MVDRKASLSGADSTSGAVTGCAAAGFFAFFATAGFADFFAGAAAREAGFLATFFF
jgi:hypothetical protein